MFSNLVGIKIVPLTIETLYINPHSNQRVQIDSKSLKNVKTFIVKQVGKNGVDIQFNRVVIPHNKNYIIMNIYQSIDSKKFYGKTLTVLTEGQLKTSRNMNKGKAEEYGLQLTIKSVKEDDVFFDYKEYIDYLNQSK